MITEIKELILTIIDTIDLKLRTRTGRISLLIFACIVLGGSIVHSYNMHINVVALELDIEGLEEDKKELQVRIDDINKNAIANCNEQIKQGAILQQQLQEIYNNRIERDTDFIEEQTKLMKEKEKIVSIQEQNLTKLKKLSN